MLRAKLDDPGQIERLIGQFFKYVPEVIHEFRKAVEQFKQDLPSVLAALRGTIEKAETENTKFKQAAIKFLKHAQETINPSVTAADVREMLIQHILTEEIFSQVFDNSDFHHNNNVAKELYDLEATFFTGGIKRESIERLKPYYAAIKRAAAVVFSHQEKQKFLKVIYENFYKVYNKKAADRLGVAYIPKRTYRVSIDEIMVFQFGTKLGVVQVTTRVTPDSGDAITALELLEAEVALARIHRLRWIAEDQPSSGPILAISLDDLIQMAVFGYAEKKSAPGRAPTATYVRLEKSVPSEQADALATYLARHYTTDYELVEHPKGLSTVRHFETVGHVFAPEGACTVISPSQSRKALPSFLEGYKENAFRKHYLPLTVLALHERAFLIGLGEKSMVVPSGRKDLSTVVDHLTEYKKLFLAFRWQYRFSEIGNISMHNDVNHALRAVFGLDTMHREISTDIAENETFLRACNERRASEIEDERQQRYYSLTVIGAASLTTLTAVALAKELFEALHFTVFDHRWAAAAGLAIFLASCIVGYFKRPSGHSAGMNDGRHKKSRRHGEHGELQGTALEQVLHKSLE